MRTILIAVIVLAIVAVLIVDGLGMYAAHRIVVEVAEGAAEQAAQVYVATDGSERAAQDVAQGIASEADVQLVSADYHAATTRWYQVTMRAQPDVFFLDHLPYVRDLLAQESTATVHF
jgi:type II secretory pathway pseudopilin PulG